MAITDELRREAQGDFRYLYTSGQEKHLLAIADRIDAEHAEAQRRWMAEVDALREERDEYLESTKLWEAKCKTMVELPRDADGEPIHVGDKVTCGASVWEVTGFRFTDGFWGICCTIFFDQGGSGTNVYPTSELHHYRASTVEDVLTEFGIDWEHEDNCEDRAALLAEYAAKLRLAGEGE